MNALPIYMKVSRQFKEEASMYAMKKKLLSEKPDSITQLMIIATREYMLRHPIP